MHSYQLFEPGDAELSAHDHLVRFIREYGADEAAGSTGLVLDLTGDEPLVILPPPPAPTAIDEHRPAVVSPVVNRARYRRVGIDGVSTRPGQLSELATLVDDDTGEPDVLRLVLAAQRRTRHPSAGPPHPTDVGTAG